MLQGTADLHGGQIELCGKVRLARHQLSGLDGDALPLLAAPICREQKMKIQPGGVGLGVPFPVGQAARERHEPAGKFNVQALFLLFGRDFSFENSIAPKAAGGKGVLFICTFQWMTVRRKMRNKKAPACENKTQTGVFVCDSDLNAKETANSNRRI